MTEQVRPSGGWRTIPWRIIGWATAALLLLLPLVAGAPWTTSDFVVAGVLLASIGLAFELIVRKSGSLSYQAGAALAFVTAVVTFWVNGAVGMIGSEANPYNLLFGAVLLIALAGAIAGWFRAAGMARAMVMAAIAQAAIAAFGLAADPLGAALSIGFAAPWLLAAVLFRHAALRP